MKKTYYLNFLLFIMALLLPATVAAHDFEVDGIYYNINGTTATVTYKGTYPSMNSNDYSGLVTIPATVTYGGITYSVTAIGNDAFYYCTNLTSITIPNSVTSIGNGAFNGCSSLTTINIGNSVTTIGNSAFHDCTSLTNINVPNSVTTIGNGAFYRCRSLTSVTIPNSVTTLDSQTFWDCSSLASINIPNSVTSIGNGAFYDCSSLTNINIPNSVTTIGNYAFTYCSSLTNINIPNSVTTIGEYAFENCPSLADISVTSDNPNYDSRNNCNAIIETATNTLIAGCKNTIIPNSVTTIGNSAFAGCSNLTTINIPNSVASIGNSAFANSGLSAINIPNSIITIGVYAFSSCDSLTSISIVNSVSSIGYGAFAGCSSINNVYCFATTPPACNDNYSTFSDYSATLHVPAASLAAYFTAPEWSKFENIVGDAVAPTGITISSDSVEVQSGEQIELTATVTPANASCKEVTWYSTDTSIATVENGIITAVGIGECDIFAYCMGMPATCHITVTNRISLEQQEAMLLPNHMLVLNPIAPAMPSGFTVTSSDPTVAAARVMNGKVQIVGIKEGTTTITVCSADGIAQPATCLVTVYTEPGDLNSDGFVNIGDVTSLIDYLLNADDASVTTKNADVNGDGSINIADVTSLIDKLLSGTTD